MSARRKPNRLNIEMSRKKIARVRQHSSPGCSLVHSEVSCTPERFANHACHWYRSARADTLHGKPCDASAARSARCPLHSFFSKPTEPVLTHLPVVHHLWFISGARYCIRRASQTTVRVTTSTDVSINRTNL